LCRLLEGEPGQAVEKLQLLTEFSRVGGSVEAASEIVAAAVGASPDLAELLLDLEDLRFQDPEGYADQVLILFSQCVEPFFGLGIRPPEGLPVLPSIVRSRVKRVRLALRDLVVGSDFVALSFGEDGRVAPPSLVSPPSTTLASPEEIALPVASVEGRGRISSRPGRRNGSRGARGLNPKGLRNLSRPR
ncbi:unnamed protein product, partial [Polarella glacialis]